METLPPFREAALLTDLHVHRHPWRELLGDDDGVALPTGKPQAVGGISRQVLQRDHSHPNQVAAVDPLIALRYNGLYSLWTHTKKTYT